MKLKRGAAFLMTGALAIGMVGCGSSNGTDSKDSSKDDGVLTFWAYEPQSIADKEAYQALLEEFATETGNTVKATFIPKDNFNTKLSSALANGKGPDISYLDQPLLAGYAKDGTLFNITDKINSSSLDTTSFFESALETNEFEGAYYGLPLNITTSVILYNKDLVSDSELPTNWTDWVTLAQKVAENPEKAAFEEIGTGGYLSWYYQAFLCNAGGSLTNEAEDEITFQQEPGVKAAQLLKDLYDASPEEIRASNSAFGNGNVAFTLGSGAEIDSLEQNFPNLNFGAMLIPPAETGGTSYSNIGGENLVIYADSANQDAAFELLTFLSEKENAQKISEYTGNFSALKELAVADDEKKQVVLEQLNTAIPRPQLEGWLTVNDSYLGDALENILAGSDIQEQLNTAAEQASALLFK